MTTKSEAEKIEGLRLALDQISKVGGNLPDDRLMSRTGPNDAVSRGIMYVTSRDIAINALAELSENQTEITA